MALEICKAFIANFFEDGAAQECNKCPCANRLNLKPFLGWRCPMMCGDGKKQDVSGMAIDEICGTSSQVLELTGQVRDPLS